MNERHVLVIEDDPLNRKLVHALLTIGGYRVREAGTAEEGIALAREEVPDCIVMDIRLPGMDGLGATRLIKQDPALKGVPVIALTAFAMSGDEQKAAAAGCDAYITKPLDSSRLLGAIGQFTRAPAPAPTAAAGVVRVLIVDDDPQMVKLLSAQLSREGHQAIGARGGEEAIRMAQQDPPHLILMDVLMPGIDGYEATRRLKRSPSTAHIPIILVTALSDVQDKLKGLEAGADEFLSKPFNQAELAVRMKNMLKLMQFEEQLKFRALSVDSAFAAPAGAARAGSGAARILLVCREGEERSSLREHLEGRGYRVVIPRNCAEDLFAGDQRTTDLVILDSQVTGADARGICSRLKEREDTRHVPLVVIAGPHDAEERVRFLSLGADDLLPRPVDPRELEARVGRLLKQKAHLDSLQSSYRSAVSAAANDGLTNLFNHAYFKRFLELEVKRSQRQDHPTSLVLIDIDDFKSKNDTLGHAAGDLILGEVARRIRSCIREIDLPARYGGEEFAVVLPYTDRSGAAVVAERIRSAIASEEFLRGTSSAATRVTVSIGLAICPEHAKLAGELIHAADSMLYLSKKEGKNRVSCHGS
jgi:two-component system, cell cycle response regulator